MSAWVVYEQVFRSLARRPVDEVRVCASEIWEFATTVAGYRPDELDARHLESLGLARRVVDRDYPDEMCWEYGPEQDGIRL